MSDAFDLDDLKKAMTNATPAPDATRRADNLALAQKNFESLQGSADEARLTSEAPQKRLFRGVFAVLRTFPAKAALTATTAIVAVGMVVYLPALNDAPNLKGALQTFSEQEAASDAVLVEPQVEPVVAANEAAPIAEFTGQAAPPQPLARMANGQVMGKVRATAADNAIVLPAPNTEAFPEADSNPVKVAIEDPVSTFSIDVDTATYGIVRNSINNGYLPPKDAVRIEEMVNYFPYDYAAPEQGDVPFATHVSVIDTPWNPDTQIVHIGLQGQKPVIEDRPPLNLVFLIDTSGSMNSQNKLPLLKQSFALMLSELHPDDSVSIVTYAGSAGQVLEPTPASDRAIILGALNNLQAGGSTAGQAGLQQAYAVAEQMQDEGEISRVILATDGDFNIGLADPEALKEFIADKRDSGTYLSVLGFGRGNLDDATMQALAQNGNGQAAYIDTLNEAQKVLVDQLTGALFPIANDVKIQVEFNPAQIAEYRLIGYETRLLNREDFNNDKVDAGDIGAGHSVTALYEVTPVDSDARLTDPLRYGRTAETLESDEWGYLKLRYKAPGESESKLIETPILPDAGGTREAQFAAAIAGFGQLLKDDKYLGNWGWGEAIALANGSKGDDPFGYRVEAVQLMRLAQSLDAQ